MQIKWYAYTMARKPRIQYSGAFYHIVVRGNQRQNIFLKMQTVLSILSEGLRIARGY